ncbi:trypsin-like peptidase domain-containing protein [Streptomyces sp. NPDC051287]|uniref:VMAP-C domain-containing protein n=1 Tax=Streptomyces sp. NPDC051287 TaxID=3365648 RepID=UPI00379D1E67
MTGPGDGSRSGGRAATHALRDLARAATVRIHRAGAGYARQEFLGSGFFIAPNWVLTCAHVIRGGEGGEVTVVCPAGRLGGPYAVPGRVAATLPERAAHAGPDDWPDPDLALVRLREPVEHQCLYVSERPVPHYAEGRVYYAGWGTVGGRPRPIDGFLPVHGTVGGWSAGARLRLGGDELPRGVSGAPVIDPVRGEVVGVLRTGAEQGADGTAIGIERLRTLPVAAGAPPYDPHRDDPNRSGPDPDDLYQTVCHAHDRYHRDRQLPGASERPTWTDVQAELGARPGRVLSPHERVDLLGRLADLSPPDSTRGLLDILQSLPDFRLPALSPAPRGWRDGLGALYENVRHGGTLPLVVEYAMRVMTAERRATPHTLDAEQALWEWIMRAAAPLGSGPRGELARRRARHLDDRLRGGEPGAGYRTGGPAGEPGRFATRLSVQLQIDHLAWDPEHCDWSIATVRPDGEVTRLDEGQGAGLADLAARLAGPLAEAFRRCDEPGRPVALYAALPQHLLDLPVDEWRLRPGADPLGGERPVLVRCADRDQLPGEEDGHGAGFPYDEDFARRERWRRLHDAHGRGGARAEILDSGDSGDSGHRPVPPLSVLRSLPAAVVPVLCREDDRYDEEDGSALSRIIRAGYGVVLWRRRRRPSDVPCGEFHRGARTTVDEADGAAELPALMHGLRERMGRGPTESSWARGVALLYDDPDQPLPGTDDLLEAP